MYSSPSPTRGSPPKRRTPFGRHKMSTSTSSERGDRDETELMSDVSNVQDSSGLYQCFFYFV